MNSYCKNPIYFQSLTWDELISQPTAFSLIIICTHTREHTHACPKCRGRRLSNCRNVMLLWSIKRWKPQPQHETYGMHHTKAYVWEEVKLPQINFTNNGGFNSASLQPGYNISISVWGGCGFCEENICHPSRNYISWMLLKPEKIRIWYSIFELTLSTELLSHYKKIRT
jgi:hypothetical protein